MKVFISWSGDLSHKVAVVLRDWLPSVIQTLKPYVSSEDIDKGARWSLDIASELDQSSFGILCVTKENVTAPWLNFEAGALSKSIDKSKVCPFLFRIKRSEVEGPILQYQSTIYENEDTFKLLKSINDACDSDGISETQLEKTYQVWWSQLKNNLDSIEDIESVSLSETDENITPGDDYVSGILEELLELSRTNQKLLRNPESILPFDYFDYLYRKLENRSDKEGGRHSGLIEVDEAAFQAMIKRYRELLRFIDKSRKDPNVDQDYLGDLTTQIRRVDDHMKYLIKGLDLRLPTSLYDDFELEY